MATEKLEPGNSDYGAVLTEKTALVFSLTPEGLMKGVDRLEERGWSLRGQVQIVLDTAGQPMHFATLVKVRAH